MFNFILIKYRVILILILCSTAIIILAERKVLALSQFRKGPTKIFFKGLAQPLADFIKLFNKAKMIEESNKTIIFVTPFLLLLIFIFFWYCLPIVTDINPNWSLLFFFLLLGFNLYPIVIAGWYTNNKFGFIRCYRRLNQIISYELAIIILFLRLVIYTKDLEIGKPLFKNIFIILPIIRFLIVISMLIELNRTPFDIRESERELVSGYITEYGGYLFRFFFLCEYGIIIFFSIIIRVLLTINFFFTILFIIIIILTRAFLPRTRYDKQIKFAWKLLLPVTVTLTTTRFIILI